MHSSFTVAGMPASSVSHHGHGPTAWSGSTSGGPLALGDSLSQSRAQYQPGYLMSASQNNTSPQGNQRVEEPPLVKTKAKMNHTLLRGSASDFGMDSMFESSRQRRRQAFVDEDAPPTNSVNDIPTEFHSDFTAPTRFLPTNSSINSPSLQRRQSRNHSSQQPQTLHVIVFGYPADKYNVTIEYFQSLGPTAEPEPHTEVVNCFRMGYLDPADAMRAVRKNGEILGGSWMVGVKWADATQAESLLGQRGVASSGPLLDIPNSQLPTATPDDTPHRVRATATPTIGTPIKLAPSTLAFRKGDRSDRTTAISTPNIGATTSGIVSTPGQSPNKGVLSQVSDLIFGCPFETDAVHSNASPCLLSGSHLLFGPYWR